MRSLNRSKQLGLLALSLCFVLSPSARAQKDVHAALIEKSSRKPAPTFHLPDAQGQITPLSTYRGKVVLLNFWATKCGGCILEVPSFIDLQKTYGGGKFTAVGISADMPYEGLKTADEAWKLVHPFIASHGLNYPILMGNDAIITAYGFQMYPATYLNDKTGKIAATYEGVVDKADVAKNITALLSER